MNITLRQATIEDSPHILAWRNEASTIPWMGAARALTVEEHESWFHKVLHDPKSLFFVILVDNEPSGQIRYYLTNEHTAKVSINITQRLHGKGVASYAFKKGSELVRALSFAQTIFAYVLPDNMGSIRAMEKAGYRRGEMVEVHGIPHLTMHDRA